MAKRIYFGVRTIELDDEERIAGITAWTRAGGYDVVQHALALVPPLKDGLVKLSRQEAIELMKHVGEIPDVGYFDPAADDIWWSLKTVFAGLEGELPVELEGVEYQSRQQ